MATEQPRQRRPIHKETSASLRVGRSYAEIKVDGKEVREYAADLGQTVFGQERACMEVASAVLRSQRGYSDPGRPIFVGMFAGETGSGKTEMGRAIARKIRPRDPEAAVLVIKCEQQFQGPHDVAKLIGAPPGYVGYGNPDGILITPEFLERPNVIVFDEVEKAPYVWNTLMAIMEDGKLTAQIGTATYQNVKTVDLNFANSHIILTTNAGAEQIQNAKAGRGRMGFGTGDGREQGDIVEAGMKAIEEHWRQKPEFLARIDATVVFDSLTTPVYERILGKFLAEANANQRYGSNQLHLTPEVRDHVIGRIDRKYGARSLRKVFNNLILTPASEAKGYIGEDEEFTAALREVEGQEPQITFYRRRRRMQKARVVPIESGAAAIVQVATPDDSSPQPADPGAMYHI